MKGMKPVKDTKKTRNAFLHDGNALFKTSFMTFIVFMSFMLK